MNTSWKIRSRPIRVARWGWWLAGALASGFAMAQPAPGPGPRAACEATAPTQLLVPMSLGAAGAAGQGTASLTAYWLDRHHLRVPTAAINPLTPADVANGERWVLAAAANGALALTPGQPLGGADQLWPLEGVTAPADISPAVRERFRFVGPGLELRLAAATPGATGEDAAARDERLRRLLRDPVMLVRLDAAGRVLQAMRAQTPGALDDLYATAEQVEGLGATPRPLHTRFRLWAPTARAVWVCLEAPPEGLSPLDRMVGRNRLVSPEPMSVDRATGVWSARVLGALKGWRYTYLVEVWVPGVGLVRNRVTDPYSVALSADSARSVVADLNDAAFKPEGWDAEPRPAPLAAMTDLSVYELHVRDFSWQDETVPAADRGKYLGFTHPQSDGMQHLRRLARAGVTDVHLLPVFDIATVPERGCQTLDFAAMRAAVQRDGGASRTPGERSRAAAAADCFNWGYDPFHFNTPEGSYSSNADDPAARVRELRAAVMALHRAGLRVGMDKVYNHTSASGQHPQSVLDRIVPGYYHRLDARGTVERSTCCDNTATEHRMMRKLMIESVRLWAVHYRMDSFRFDLMGHQPREAMQALQADVRAATGREIRLLGEGWNFGEVSNGARFVQASQLSLNGSGIATFSDRMRDAARGGGAGDNVERIVLTQGWLSGLGTAPNEANRGTASGGLLAEPVAARQALQRAADLVRVGLAGSLRAFEMQTVEGDRRRLEQIDYAGQPAGYVSQPGEVVNYVENHDNPTLWDNLAFKMPIAATAEERLQAQVLGGALVAFSQGVAYWHAGQEILRSKSLDRNSFDSGDWFNRLDWTLQDNGFAAGLPPGSDNEAFWPLMGPRLSAPQLKPSAEQIRRARDAHLDLMSIRASSSLFRLRAEADVRQRLRFLNTGPTANPAVIVGWLEGRGHPEAGFAEVLYVLNADAVATQLALPEVAGAGWQLHPVLASAAAADARIREQSRLDAATGRLTVPARSATVWVRPQ